MQQGPETSLGRELHCTKGGLAPYSGRMTEADHTSAWDRQTLQFYDREASLYAASSKSGASRWLNTFMRGLPTGARILELGCGNGRDADVLLAHGFDVDATDGSPGMVAEAKRKIGSCARVMRFDELSDITAYDGIWANASLLHVPISDLAHVLALIFRALKPHGLHLATFKSGNIPGRDTLGRYYNALDQKTLAAAYSRSGCWEILSMTEYVSENYSGNPDQWVAIEARKPL